MRKLIQWPLKGGFVSVLLLLFLVFGLSQSAKAWGFWAHQRINRLAVFTLPPEMIVLYKKHIEYLTAHAVDPDSRRYAVEGEAPRHFIDIDHYGTYPFDNVPRKWREAVEKFGEDSLMEYGIVPWHINHAYYDLRDAFKAMDVYRIIKLSADIGHYIADSNVPLHTTENYNGQLTGQKGIHGLWESRLPELFAENYDFFVGHAQYFENVQMMAWETVLESHLALDSVFGFERELTKKFDSDKKYSFENRSNVLVKAYSKEFCTAYHKMLAGMVERRMRSSIVRVGSIWYTAWVDAGQPDLRELATKELEPEKEDQEKRLKIKDRESGEIGMNMNPWEIMFGECCGHGLDHCRKAEPPVMKDGERFSTAHAHGHEMGH